ncbi:hypothetical protein Ae505Ps2_1786c [Pseudonocardia sp. Ae505_Ps2]|nr:hypothetical protein Ae505Ps2_1786c [Pseudonocardia sp. Ae505_Ps2]
MSGHRCPLRLCCGARPGGDVRCGERGRPRAFGRSTTCLIRRLRVGTRARCRANSAGRTVGHPLFRRSTTWRSGSPYPQMRMTRRHKDRRMRLLQRRRCHSSE